MRRAPFITDEGMRSIRDTDRRFYRRNTLWIFVPLFVTVVPVRIALDTLLARRERAAYTHLKLYVTLGIALTAALIIIIGLKLAFRRRYP